jgi:hypothetical protein
VVLYFATRLPYDRASPLVGRAAAPAPAVDERLDGRERTMKKLSATVAMALFLCGAPGTAAAQSAANVRDYLGPFLDLGGSVRAGVLRVHSPDGPYGEFVSTRFLPMVTIGSPMFTWGKDGRYGLNVVWSTTRLEMNRQTPPDGDWLAGDKQNVGTSVDGYVSYLVPTLNFINTRPQTTKLDAIRAGFGVGLGYLRAKGDILLNRSESDSDDSPPANPELRRLEIDDLLPAFTMFMEGRRGPWTIGLSVSAVAEFKSYETDYIDFGLSLSYSWYSALRPKPPAAPAPEPAPASAP